MFLRGMNLVIPLAGLGSRFVKKGINTPKYLLHASGKRIIEWVIDSLNIDEYSQIIFILNQAHCLSHASDRVLKELYPNSEIVILPELTDGTTRTVLYAEDIIKDKNIPLVIHTSDVWSNPRLSLDEFDFKEDDGYLLTFKANSPGYSYSEITDKGQVTRTREKQRISRYANVGIYAFKSFNMFKKYAEQAIENEEMYNKEYYIAPIYNGAIEDGRKIMSIERKNVHVMGTPEEYEFFINHVNLNKENLTIGLVSDHSGFKEKEEVKRALKRRSKLGVLDFGCYSSTPCDYPDFVIPAAQELEKNRIDILFAFCHSGQGVNICLNKHSEIISCLINNQESLELAVAHNCPNAYSFSCINFKDINVEKMIDAVVENKFEGGRHSVRLQKVLDINKGK